MRYTFEHKIRGICTGEAVGDTCHFVRVKLAEPWTELVTGFSHPAGAVVSLLRGLTKVLPVSHPTVES